MALGSAGEVAEKSAGVVGIAIPPMVWAVGVTLIVSLVFGFGLGYLTTGASDDCRVCENPILNTSSTYGGEFSPTTVSLSGGVVGDYDKTTTTVYQFGEDSTTSTTLASFGEINTSNIQTICIEPPQASCECTRWQCTTTTTTTTTTTLCKTVFDSDYVPTVRHYKLKLEGGEFEPDRVKGFLGDTIIVSVYNKKGLYTLRDPSNNKTVLLRPEETHIFSFKADRVGEYYIDCTEHCDGLGITVKVLEPTKQIC